MDGDSRQVGCVRHEERSGLHTVDTGPDDRRPRRIGRLVGRAAMLAVTLLAASRSGLAHGGQIEHASHSGNGTLALAVLGGGALILGTSVYLDRAGELEGPWKDVGVLLGIVGVLAGVTLALL